MLLDLYFLNTPLYQASRERSFKFNKDAKSAVIYIYRSQLKFEFSLFFSR